MTQHHSNVHGFEGSGVHEGPNASAAGACGVSGSGVHPNRRTPEPPNASGAAESSGSGFPELPNARTPERPNAFVVAPKLLALDFDGVICDTAHETLRSTWQVYREIWGGQEDAPPQEAAESYRRLRPALEIGWESPLLLRAILEGVPEATVLADPHRTWRQRIMEAHHLTPADLMRRFDAARDTWIRTDLPGWLGAQAFYPGVAERLIQLLREGMEILILTTKEGRFAHRLLEAHGVPLPLPQVWGKEQASPKTDLLQRLLREQSANAGDIWFVEDRLETLRSVTKRADLEGIRLFLATWGYNTAGQREEAAADSRIVPIALKQFCGDFSAWVEPMAARSDERTNAP